MTSAALRKLGVEPAAEAASPGDREMVEAVIGQSPPATGAGSEAGSRRLSPGRATLDFCRASSLDCYFVEASIACPPRAEPEEPGRETVFA